MKWSDPNSGSDPEIWGEESSSKWDRLKSEQRFWRQYFGAI